MTNEAAIKVLKLFKECNEKLQPKIVFESVDSAMSALENIDRITAERDAAIRDLHSLENKHGECGFCKHYSSPMSYCTAEDGTVICDAINNDMWEWRGIE